MKEQGWQGALREDHRLTAVWFAMHALVLVSLMATTLLMRLSLPFLALVLLVVGGAVLASAFRWRPSAWFASGQLALVGDRMRWQAQTADGAWVEGALTVNWRGVALVGLSLAGPAGRIDIWVTRRRVGDVAWWQLQRWLYLNQ